MRTYPYANLLIGAVLIGLHWGTGTGAAVLFIGLALLGKSTTDHTDHADKNQRGKNQ
jgi:hypothetical protein